MKKLTTLQKDIKLGTRFSLRFSCCCYNPSSCCCK